MRKPAFHGATRQGLNGTFIFIYFGLDVGMTLSCSDMDGIGNAKLGCRIGSQFFLLSNGKDC